MNQHIPFAPDSAPAATAPSLARDETLKAAIAQALRTEIHWLFPRDRTVTVTVDGAYIAVTLGRCAAPQPRPLPFDPRFDTSLSPRFAAILCWIIGLPHRIFPTITAISIAHGHVFAATNHHPYPDMTIGDWTVLEHDIRSWFLARGANTAIVDTIIRRVLRAGLPSAT